MPLIINRGGSLLSYTRPVDDVASFIIFHENKQSRAASE